MAGEKKVIKAQGSGRKVDRIGYSKVSSANVGDLGKSVSFGTSGREMIMAKDVIFQVKQKSHSVRAILNDQFDLDISIKFYRPLYANPVAILSNAKHGLAATAAIDFLNLSGFTQTEFQATFKTTVKTIQNYATQQLKLDSVLSEKLLKAFALFEKGIEVFGSAQAFHDWLNQPAFGLGGALPYDLMDTITGIMLIEEELIRLEYGDLA